jgi:prephenate dehydrogenase
MIRQSVVLGGGGAVGRLFTGLLRDGGPVTPVDRAGDGRAGLLPVDATRPGADLAGALAAADVVVLALPHGVAVPAARAARPFLRPGTLLVDTLSVKRDIVPALAELARAGDLEAVSVNPMFAPPVGFAGQPVAVIEVRGGPHGRWLSDRMAARGARPVAVRDAAEHDTLTAALQVATHASVLAFGVALAGLGVAPATLVELAPPPHRTMLALLARIVAGNPEVYREIQHDHPAAPRVRAELRAGLARLDGPAEDFAALLDGLTRWYGASRTELAAHCAALFDTHRPGAATPTSA